MLMDANYQARDKLMFIDFNTCVFEECIESLALLYLHLLRNMHWFC